MKASLVVHAAALAPAPMPAHPDEIHVWFQSATGKAFVLCAQGWVAWAQGVAIKDVCTPPPFLPMAGEGKRAFATPDVRNA